ncbi:MAG TPA: carboxypeptidase-like regulatory domain-containing protein [Acidobacteriaceae bacterium]|nr:carboxypeptidase-like regulatory domain-containing protein [Acidobacteriaceae bacterium]
MATAELVRLEGRVNAMTKRQGWTAVIAAMVMAGVAATRAHAAERRAQAPVAAAAYVDENGTDPAPLHLRELEGKVVGLGGDAMPRTEVALYTENGHTLVATATSDREGKFRFDKVEKGLYRVVARIEGLCPANIPVRIESSLLGKRKLIITMRPKDLDTCSYGVAK